MKDLRAKAKILFKIQELENDEHFGDCESVGDGIRELKINYAKGYRIYFKEKDGKLLFCCLVETNQLNKKTLEKRKN